ncbi:E3 ubiquitin-protein ligase RFWD3-like [Carya illinoinensis]|uniref:RING-type domain-containing protein n=1 Tax=Carya illinoinensis TaxID=32201 RepID=A0A8T1N548_CARIL|nr:E3 ubiquitin-protein ligase RFWD3-like [Carya illinoinensis]KAG6624137.1 hypothetical protein CIPAW_16G005400 [Carya illinoinensis]
MASVINPLFMELSDQANLQAGEVPTAGRVEVRLSRVSLELDGRLILDDNLIYPTRTLFVVEVPSSMFPAPEQQSHYLYTQISSNLINLNIGRDDGRRHVIASKITSFAAQRPQGYSIVAVLGTLVWVQSINQGIDYEVGDDGHEDSAVADGGEPTSNTTPIDQLMEKGGFVASKEEADDLGTCSICLEDFSSSVGAELLRTYCSHIYHRDCIMPWLAKSKNACPSCRAKLMH